MNFCVLETILNSLLINLKFFESGLDCKNSLSLRIMYVTLLVFGAIIY